MFTTVDWKDDAVVMLDQTLLPQRVVYRRLKSWQAVADAIRRLVVRGAPAIGVAGAMGVALGASRIRRKDPEGFKKELKKVVRGLARTRPTAVNLFWALERMEKMIDAHAGSKDELTERLLEEAIRIKDEDIEVCRRIGRHGARLVKKNYTILTHCNAGGLATAGYGTALGVIRRAHQDGKNIKVLVDETRPVLQGARLTMWELLKEGIPATLITDNMAGYMMQQGIVDCVIVGADRIAANGDVANKIGTYSVATLARAHRLPFYVAAPLSTIDINIPTGDAIPIEERSSKEVTHIKNIRVAPRGAEARNPAFDVTPARLVTAIITEKGVLRPPFRKAVKALFKGAQKR